MNYIRMSALFDKLIKLDKWEDTNTQEFDDLFHEMQMLCCDTESHLLERFKFSKQNETHLAGGNRQRGLQNHLINVGKLKVTMTREINNLANIKNHELKILLSDFYKTIDHVASEYSTKLQSEIEGQ